MAQTTEEKVNVEQLTIKIPGKAGSSGLFPPNAFSWVENTTIGPANPFSGIVFPTPLSGLARSLSITDAVVVQFLIAVLIAWLVGVYSYFSMWAKDSKNRSDKLGGRR